MGIDYVIEICSFDVFISHPILIGQYVLWWRETRAKTGTDALSLTTRFAGQTHMGKKT